MTLYRLLSENSASLLCYRTLIISSSLICLITYLGFRVYQFVCRRRRLHQIFKLGNVPQATEKPGLFGGNLFDILSDQNIVDRIHELHLKLGKTFGLFYGPDPWAMTVDLDLLQKVFVTEGKIHIDITQFRLPYVREFNESLAQLRGDSWRQVRRIMAPSFTLHNMEADNVFASIGKVCDLFLDYIEAHKSRNKTGHRMIIDVHFGFKLFALEVIFRVAFGRNHKDKLVPGESDELLNWIEQGSRLINSDFVHLSATVGWAQRFAGLLAPFTSMGAVTRYVHKVIDDSIKERRSVMDGSAHQTIDVKAHERKAIDRLIKRLNLGKLSDVSLKANLIFLLLAGFETSANSLTLMFYLLASHKRVQDKLRQSILSQGENSEYLTWVIQETLRLFPAVPAAVGRILEHDIEHNGQKFFKGTTIVSDIYSVHRWPEYWRSAKINNNNNDPRKQYDDDDIEMFRPERFGEPLPDGVLPSRYMAFGIGPRYCIGQNLAMSEMKMIIQSVISRYEVSFCETTPKNIDAVTPNLIHFIINHPVDLEFTELSTL